LSFENIVFLIYTIRDLYMQYKLILIKYLFKKAEIYRMLGNYEEVIVRVDLGLSGYIARVFSIYYIKNMINQIIMFII